jgi:hypothetical protein
MHKICIESIYKSEIFIKGNIKSICFLIENGRWWSIFSLVKYILCLCNSPLNCYGLEQFLVSL